jgi:hypothetical protein
MPNLDIIPDDDTYSISDYDTDDEEEYRENMYDIDTDDEESSTKYNVILCELHNIKIHGSVDDTDYTNINYLVHCRFKKLNMDYISGFIEQLENYYTELNSTNSNTLNHNIYRNYRNIISSGSYIKPEIAECIYLETGYCIAILKTFWIKIIQRKWKKIFAERNRVQKERCELKALRFRELNGIWPNYCRHFPTLKGMLN